MNRPSRALWGRSIPPSRPKRGRWRSRPRLYAFLLGVRSAIDFPAAPTGPRFSSPAILPGPSRSYRPRTCGRKRVSRLYRSHRPRSMDGRSTCLPPPTRCAVSGNFSPWARASSRPIATGGRGEHSNIAHRSPPVTAAGRILRRWCRGVTRRRIAYTAAARACFDIRQPTDHGFYGPPEGFRWADAPSLASSARSLLLPGTSVGGTAVLCISS